MKNILILAICLPLLSFSQQEHLTYTQASDVKFAELYKSNSSIQSYTSHDGLKISIGDTLTIGHAVSKRKKYMLGDVFTYIVVGKEKGQRNKEYKYLPQSHSGSKVIVKSFFVSHQKYKGYKLWPNRK